MKPLLIISLGNFIQKLRSSSQLLQRWEHEGASLETELALEFIDREAAIVSFPLQHTKGHKTAGDVMLLSPLRAGLTATQAELILTDSNDLFNLRS